MRAQSSCGSWQVITSDKDQRMEVTTISGADCHGTFLFTNKRGYALELQTSPPLNSSFQWQVLAAHGNSNEMADLLPSIPIKLSMNPVDSSKQARMYVEGATNLHTLPEDAALFLLKTALELVPPNQSCFVSPEQLSYAAINVSSIVEESTNFALHGDAQGARQEFSRIAPTFYAQSAQVLKQAGLDCVAESLKVVAPELVIVTKLGWAYVNWVGSEIRDYFKYQGQPTPVTFLYTPASGISPVRKTSATNPAVLTLPPPVQSAITQTLVSGKPSLASPGDGSSMDQSTNVTLSWNKLASATQYKVELWGGSYNVVMIPCDWQGATSCHIGRMWPGTMLWHVKARYGNAQDTNWSDTWRFTIVSQLSASQVAAPSTTNRPPDVFHLIAPSSSSQFPNATVPNLQWQSTSDPDRDPVRYKVMIDNANSLDARQPGEPDHRESDWLSGTSWQPNGQGLEIGGRYTWYVVADDGRGGQTGSVEHWEFSIAAQPRTATSPCPRGSGPDGITANDYDPNTLTQPQKQWLWHAFGHPGIAPIGYGGERCGEPIQSQSVGRPAAPICGSNTFFGWYRWYVLMTTSGEPILWEVDAGSEGTEFVFPQQNSSSHLWRYYDPLFEPVTPEMGPAVLSAVGISRRIVGYANADPIDNPDACECSSYGPKPEIGKIVGLRKGSGIYTQPIRGSESIQARVAIVPEDNWLVKIIGGPRYIAEGKDLMNPMSYITNKYQREWWQIDSRAAGNPDSHTGWISWRYTCETGPVSPPPSTLRPCPLGVGPGGITADDYDPNTLSPDQKQWLWWAFGHFGYASVGYGGEVCK